MLSYDRLSRTTEEERWGRRDVWPSVANIRTEPVRPVGLSTRVFRKDSVAIFTGLSQVVLHEVYVPTRVGNDPQVLPDTTHPPFLFLNSVTLDAWTFIIPDEANVSPIEVSSEIDRRSRPSMRHRY